MSQKGPFKENQMLCTRREAARVLGKSVATIARMERDGRLTPVRLTAKPTSMVSIKVAEVLAIIEGNNQSSAA